MKTVKLDPKLKDYLKFTKDNDVRHLGIENSEIADYQIINISDIDPKAISNILVLNGSKHHVENDISKISYGRFIQYQNTIKLLDDDTTELDIASRIIACFVYTRSRQRFGIHRIDRNHFNNEFYNKTVQAIEDLPLSTIYRLLLFFSRRLENFLPNIKVHYLRIRQRNLLDPQ